MPPMQLSLWATHPALEPISQESTRPTSPPRPDRPEHRSSDPLAHGESEHTRYKQHFLRRILRQQLAINGNIQAKRKRAGHPPMLHLDLFAGTGRDRLGNPGSPLIFLEEAQQTETRTHPAFFNIVPEHCASLRAALESLVPPDRAEEMGQQGECETAVPASHRRMRIHIPSELKRVALYRNDRQIREVHFRRARGAAGSSSRQRDRVMVRIGDGRWPAAAYDAGSVHA